MNARIDLAIIAGLADSSPDRTETAPPEEETGPGLLRYASALITGRVTPPDVPTQRTHGFRKR